MKAVLIVVVMVLVSPWRANCQVDERETLKQLHRHAVESSQSKAYDAAESFAEQAMKLSVKIFGLSYETGVATLNLATIQKKQGKNEQSLTNFQEAIRILEGAKDKTYSELPMAYAGLAHIQYLLGKKAEAEKSYLKALTGAENLSGVDSKEIYTFALNLANFYAATGKYDIADKHYSRSYSLAFRHFGRTAEEVEQVENSRRCIAGSARYSSKSTEAFGDVRNRYYSSLSATGDVIVGKATSLPKPSYPAAARAQKVSGPVSVRVRIDEDGNVVEATMICGDGLFRKAAVTAAEQAKFGRTLVDGNPIVVSGVVTYNFVP